MTWDSILSEHSAYLLSHWAMGAAAVVAIWWMIRNRNAGWWIVLLFCLIACRGGGDDSAFTTQAPCIGFEDPNSIEVNEYFTLTECVAENAWISTTTSPPRVRRVPAVRCGNGAECCVEPGDRGGYADLDCGAVLPATCDVVGWLPRAYRHESLHFLIYDPEHTSDLWSACT